MERLEEVQALFQHAKGRGLSTTHLEELMKEKHEKLRATTLVPVFTTCPAQDKDDSGTYDPSGRKVSPEPVRPKRKRPPVQEADDTDHEDKVVKKAKPTLLSARQQGLQLWIDLNLAFPAGKKLLKTLSESTCSLSPRGVDTNKPDEAEAEAPCLWAKYGGSFASSKPAFTSLDSLQRKSLSARRGARKDLQPGAGPDLRIGDPLARGCAPCLTSGQRCPLVDNPAGLWPCKVCREDGEECWLFPDTKKRGCERCKKKSLVCSYSQDDAHHLPCRQCQLEKVPCLAGPRTRQKRTRKPREDPQIPSRNAADLPIKDRPVTACLSCRRARVRCSLRKGAVGPCSQCSRQDQPCVIESLLQDDIPKTKKQVEETDLSTVDNSFDLQVEELLRSAGPQRHAQTRTMGQTRTIITRWSHPIDFRYLPPDDGTFPCNFCTDVKYGMLGLNERRVEVIDYGEGTGLVEMGGGNREDGQEATRMCYACALERLQIASCEKHSIGVMEGYDQETFDEGAAYEALDNDEQQCSYVWCTICPRPAIFFCNRLQTHNKFGEVVGKDEEGAMGCGLALCTSCVEDLVDNDLDLDRLIRGVATQADIFRADVDFLLRDGDLYKCYEDYCRD